MHGFEAQELVVPKGRGPRCVWASRIWPRVGKIKFTNSATSFVAVRILGSCSRKPRRVVRDMDF